MMMVELTVEMMIRVHMMSAAARRLVVCMALNGTCLPMDPHIFCNDPSAEHYIRLLEKDNFESCGIHLCSPLRGIFDGRLCWVLFNWMQRILGMPPPSPSLESAFFTFWIGFVQVSTVMVIKVQHLIFI